MSNPHGLCVDAYPPGERFDPADLPPPLDLRTTSSKELAVSWRCQWQPGQELRIRFLDGDRHVRALVQEYAETWLAHANLRFRFGNFADAEIRVSFVGDGYWSLLGTMALRVTSDEPTMVLDGFTAGTDRTVLRRTVLHEFGHAIGCVHEQASPAARIPWNEAKVYAYYQQWQGWNRDTVYHNVLRRYSGSDVRFSNYDPRSIMQYPVVPALTDGRLWIDWNNELSDGDRSFVARMYP